MPRPREAVVAGVEELRGRDPVIDGLIDQHGVPALRSPVPASRRFEYLAESIAYQQLHGSAAAAIWGRVVDRAGGAVRPDWFLSTAPEDLRATGLSGAKVAALTDLAVHVDDGRVRLGRLGQVGDDEIIARLTQVRGIGEWTAHMFLMFALGRLDVWPTGDFGVRNGLRVAWELDEIPPPREAGPFGEVARPYRSLLAWWCWRATDNTGGRSG